MIGCPISGAGRRSLVLLTAMLVAPTVSAQAGEWALDVMLESRSFFQAPREKRQEPEHQSFAAAIAPEYAMSWDDGDQGLVFEGFARWDASDEARTNGDVRDLFWRLSREEYDFSLGLRRVFWGVTESVHLVDIINQSDLAENPDGEDKLGQPMARLAWILDTGTLEFYALPVFRERRFPSVEGRLRPFLPVRRNATQYESRDGDEHLDGALRYVASLRGWDFGLSYFDGTSREPRLLFGHDGAEVQGDPPPECALSQLPAPLDGLAPDCEQYFTVTLRNPHLRPYYDQIRQYGLELQRLSEGWFLKLEAIYRDSAAQRYAAAATGFEYTFGGVWASATDLTLVMEYLYDERGRLDPDSDQGMATRRLAEGGAFTVAEARRLQELRARSYSPFQNDLFIGSRIALNDVAGSEALIGAIVDLEDQTTLASVEASRRLSADWKLAVEARWFGDAPPTDPLYSFARDSYLQLELTRFF